MPTAFISTRTMPCAFQGHLQSMPTWQQDARLDSCVTVQGRQGSREPGSCRTSPGWDAMGKSSNRRSLMPWSTAAAFCAPGCVSACAGWAASLLRRPGTRSPSP